MSFQFYDDLDKFDQLESERTSIMNDPKYQQWVKELNISQSYVEPDGYIRAKELNSQLVIQNATLSQWQGIQTM